MLEKKKNKRPGFGRKFYRDIARPKGLVNFNVTIKETDLWISAKKILVKEATELILDARHQIESYIDSYPEFLVSLSPWQQDLLAPVLIKEMITASIKANVGPMAAVAGAIAEYVGRGLLKFSDEVIIENGGDIFIYLKRSATVSIFSNSSTNIGMIIKKDMMPVGICSSSGKIGHSLSFGRSDVVTVISHLASVADAAATSIANRIKEKSDIKNIGKWASQIDEVLGVVAMIDGDISLWGDIELTL